MNKTVRAIILTSCITLLAFLSDTPAQVQAPKQGEASNWIVPGLRHGPSYFPRNFLKETTPLQEGVMDFKHYHKYTEQVEFFKKWEKQYANLVDLYVVAQSYGGVDIYQLTVTNKSTGKATDKPAMYVEGNRHAGEVTAAESVLWMLNYMLTNYGKDKEVTRLLDNFAFYFRPCNNPDGSLLYLETAQTLRSTIHPYDDDGDGLVDEDPAEDLNGDGFITQMRYKVPMGQGNYIIDPRDPSGRLMRPVTQGQQGDYRVVGEGIDNDKDGRVNEDGIGGLDLHRNYVENWRPMREETGRGQTQGGAGEYPLSEIETRSVVTFLLTHPNVSVANSMDTTVPMLLRPPSTSPSDERMYPDDLALYKTFDQKGKEITGYARAGDVYLDYSGGRGSPLFGHGPDFGYWYYGAIWYGDELYDGGRSIGDYNKDGVTDDLDRLQYCDKELKMPRFHPWTKAIHPEYGEVEIGGFDGKFMSQNPPPEKLEGWAEKEARFNLMLAASLPHVEMQQPEVTGQGDEYTIAVSVQNQGFIPTALRQAQLVKIVRPDNVSLVFPSGIMPSQGRGFGGRGGGGGGRGGGRGDMPPGQPETPAAPSKVVMVEPQQPVVTIDRLAGNETKSVTFKVRLNGIPGTECTVRYASTRGGVVDKKIYIGKK
jgi:hypothetical protein